jgi:hypothetical protein
LRFNPHNSTRRRDRSARGAPAAARARLEASDRRSDRRHAYGHGAGVKVDIGRGEGSRVASLALATHHGGARDKLLGEESLAEQSSPVWRTTWPRALPRSEKRCKRIM